MRSTRFLTISLIVMLLLAGGLIFSSRAAKIQAFQIALNPLGKTPLAALANVVTSQPSRVQRIEIEGGLTSSYPNAEFSVEHEIAILGLRPGMEQRIRLVLADKSGAELVTPWRSVTTKPLPQDFPKLKSVLNSGKFDSGYLLFFVSQWNSKIMLPFPEEGYLIISDCSGQVYWYQKKKTLLNEVRMDSEGHLVIQDALGTQLYRQDLLGRKSFVYQAVNLAPQNVEGIPLATDTTHHDFVFDKSNKLCWTLGSKKTGNTIDDLIIGFDKTGEIHTEISLLSLLPEKRKDRPSAFGVWDRIYGGRFEDWTHANSLDIDSTGQYGIVSLRHQDAVICVDLQKKSLVWILGSPEEDKGYYSKYHLKAKGPLQWPAKQHAATWSSRGTLLLFDNGMERSRVAEFRIDAAAKTIEQVWEFRDETPFFSPILCDVDEVHQSEHLQITDGGRREKPDHYWARILQVSRDSSPQKSWELQIRSEESRGVSVYRSERLQSLYGAVDSKAEWARE